MSSDKYATLEKIPLKEGYQPKPKRGDRLDKGYQPNQGNLDRNNPPRQDSESKNSNSESDS